MVETRYPQADWNPGANAGYNAGRNQMRVCVCHFTVGVDSTPVGKRGYFHFLISRDGYVQQFAELDAVCWHAGEWNQQGPGIEVEYLEGRDSAIFTDPARAACGNLVRWVAGQGVPLVYYDGARVPVGSYTGFISHRSLIQTEQHYDYWPQSDWDAMVKPPAPLPKECHMYIVRQAEGGKPFKHTGGRLVPIDDATYTALLKAGVVEVPAWPASEIQAEQAALAHSGAAGGWTTATLTGKITVP